MSRNTLGALLILIGLFVTLSNLGLIGSGWMLFFVGSAFLIVYSLRGGRRTGSNLGFLIPGSIIVMLWAFTWLDSAFDLGAASGGVFFLCIGVAFFFIYFIHTRPGGGAGNYWPAITGGSLFLFGLLVLSVEMYDSPLGRSILQHAASLGLVAAGVIILWNNRKSRP